MNVPFKEYEFLAGISTDGPQNYMTAGAAIQARYFAKVICYRASENHIKQSLILTTIFCRPLPLRFDSFLKSIGSKHMQFIELLETGR